jgi:histidinol dehydrogenase
MIAIVRAVTLLLNPRRISSSQVAAEVAALGRDAARDAETEHTVREVLAAVRDRGYPAVREYSQRFDAVACEESALRVEAGALTSALATLEQSEPDLVAALRTMIANVRAFAEAERRALLDVELTLPGGGTVGQRWLPIERIGVYIPGGRAFYPSTLVMTVVPAQVAGAKRIVGVTPPRAEGPDLRVLATAALVGLEELYLVGGAQGVGYLAYGAPAVDLIAGPGNRYVAEAKRQLLGRCGIDSVAGPTEVLILADDAADPDAVAEDLLAQAEHDPDAAAVCIGDSEAWLGRVAEALGKRIESSDRRDVLTQSIGKHARLYAADFETAVAFAEAWAPEHLEVAAADTARYLPRLHAAGALFLGHATAEAFGDYGVGPNHVLPTNRTARFASPLGVQTYMKRQSVLALSAADAALASPWVARIADAEGLVHHASSARLRK